MLRKYSGSCHCGLVQFEVEANIDSVRVCNCSICEKRGALIYRVDDDKFKLISDLSALSTYQWHTKTATDYFCPKCGILPFRKPRALTQKEKASGMKSFDGWSVNVRCLQGINFNDLPIIKINGRALD